MGAAVRAVAHAVVRVAVDAACQRASLYPQGPPCCRGRGRGTSASQPEPERRSMLDEDGDLDFASVPLPLAQISPHSLLFSGNIAAYSPL